MNALCITVISCVRNEVLLTYLYHFADDTRIMQLNKSLEVLAQQLNKDISNLSYWLRAKKNA